MSANIQSLMDGKFYKSPSKLQVSEARELSMKQATEH